MVPTLPQVGQEQASIIPKGLIRNGNYAFGIPVFIESEHSREFVKDTQRALAK
jgi:hypothetical protein